MDAAKRAQEILEAAQVDRRGNEWFRALPADVQDVLTEIRSRWEATRGVTGVSAAAMSRTIIAQMPGHRFPNVKGLAEWLCRTRERTRS